MRERVAGGIQLGAAFLAAIQGGAGAIAIILAAQAAGFVNQVVPGDSFIAKFRIDRQRFDARFAGGQGMQRLSHRAKPRNRDRTRR